MNVHIKSHIIRNLRLQAKQTSFIFFTAYIYETPCIKINTLTKVGVVLDKKNIEKAKSGFISSLGYTLKDAFKEQSCVEICGNNTVTVEGSKGVLEYSDTLIRVGVNNSSLSVCGRGLTLKCISASTLIIEGYILKVEFSG